MPPIHIPPICLRFSASSLGASIRGAKSGNYGELARDGRQWGQAAAAAETKKRARQAQPGEMGKNGKVVQERAEETEPRAQPGEMAEKRKAPTECTNPEWRWTACGVCEKMPAKMPAARKAG